ncbi:MAG: hypothetical protein ACQEXJ_16770 [Myxococcota bacterium]
MYEQIAPNTSRPAAACAVPRGLAPVRLAVCIEEGAPDRSAHGLPLHAAREVTS